ncbi:MAG: UDP-N-acetylglucosamine 1-carboxyvinyltransferase [Thermaerobacterales bacterium]
MHTLYVSGGHPITGITGVPGSKNGALVLLAGCLLLEGETVLSGVPRTVDIHVFCQVMNALGVQTRWLDGHTLSIRNDGLQAEVVPLELARKIRASTYVMGPLLAKCGEARVPLPGGCNLGSRPIDLHLRAFEGLGALVHMEEDHAVGCVPGHLRGASLDVAGPQGSSMGATVSAMLAAVTARGETVIRRSAVEPEVSVLARMLNQAGAKIQGIGTATLCIQGVAHLHGTDFEVPPDRVIAGTLLLAAAATGGDVTLERFPPELLGDLPAVLNTMGVEVILWRDAIRLAASSRLRPVTTTAAPFPGVATDLHPVLAAVLTMADGTSQITDTVFPHRLAYLDELRKMGARVKVEQNQVKITGGRRLAAAPVIACALRAGTALLVAGLAAGGMTRLGGIHHIDRGWEGAERDLRALGADVERRTSAVAAPAASEPARIAV